MTTFLYLQRFDHAKPVPMPFQSVLDVLGRYGKMLARDDDACELALPARQAAFYCHVIGNELQGASCIAFERPWHDPLLREIVFACMQVFECAVFDDALEAVCVPPGQALNIPEAFRSGSQLGVREVSYAGQLWPEFEATREMPKRPVLKCPDLNPGSPGFQFFDRADAAAPQSLWLDITLHPLLCSPERLRVVRKLLSRADRAVAHHPGYQWSVCFSHSEAAMLAMDAAFVQTLKTAPEVKSLAAGQVAQIPAYLRLDFVADRGVYYFTQRNHAEFKKHLLNQFEIELSDDLESVAGLDYILNKMHDWFIQTAQSEDGAKIAQQRAMQWAVKAGSYLGTMVQNHVGAQWGLFGCGARTWPIVLTHTGQAVQVFHMVLDHIVNGPQDGVLSKIRDLHARNLSATPRGEDFVAHIPHLALGMDSRLPLQDKVPRDQLNFSQASLVWMDQYVRAVLAHKDSFSTEALTALVHFAGVYLGEVIRSHARTGADWYWVNYKDYLIRHPDFSQKRPCELGFLYFLDSAHRTYYPLAIVVAMLEGAAISLHESAKEILNPVQS